MKVGLKGNMLPESFGDFLRLRADGALRFHGCVSCCEPFDGDNTQTPAGWRETQISGMCEHCFDNLFDDEALPGPEHLEGGGNASH